MQTDTDNWRSALVARHAAYFPEHNGAPAGYPAVGNGWRVILERLFARIDDAIRAVPGDWFTVDQIKEKFGVLRVYSTLGRTADDGTAGAIRLAIDLAEARSAFVCEICGADGSLHEANGGRMATACPEHARGTRVPAAPGRSGIFLKRTFESGRLRITGCRRYDFPTDSFVDVDPADLGLES